MVTIMAVIGWERHTTSSGWARLLVDGKRMGTAEAISRRWLPPYKNRHASWCECLFEVPEGATVIWDAGANSGPRGSDRVRQKLLFIVDPNSEIFETEGLGYPAQRAKLRGRLRLKKDLTRVRIRNHEALLSQL